MRIRINTSEMENLESNGEKISFRRLGRGQRKILFFHGFPGSSSQADVFTPHLQDFDLEVLCIDRPGYGRTTAAEICQFTSTNQWINYLISQFGWSSYEAFSVSGGTPFLFPYVQAARVKPTRVIAVSGLGPVYDKSYSSLLTWKARAALRALPYTPPKAREKVINHAVKYDMDKVFKVVSYFLPRSKPDDAIMQHPDVERALTGGLKESLMQGGHGIIRDAKAYLTPWELGLGDFTGPVHFWHGKQDTILPYRMSELMAQRFPQAQIKTLDDEGHYSLIIKRLAEILS